MYVLLCNGAGGFAAPASCLGQLLVARQARRYDERGDGRARREVSVRAAEPLEREELALAVQGRAVAVEGLAVVAEAPLARLCALCLIRSDERSGGSVERAPERANARAPRSRLCFPPRGFYVRGT